MASKYLPQNEFLRFLIIGSFGFFCDLSFSFFIISMCDDYKLGRLVGFHLALMVSYVLHASCVFYCRVEPSSAVRYLLGTYLVGLGNVSMFIALVTYTDMKSMPLVIPFAIAALTAMFASYVVNRKFTFREGRCMTQSQN